MREKIEKIRSNIRKHRTLLSNFGYLSFLQLFTLIFPFITLPYLIKTLGKDVYGVVVFAQAVVSYFVILVSFGFNVSATKEISVHRDNKEKLSEIVSCVLIIKGAIFFISLTLLCIIVEFLPKAGGYKLLFFLTMYMCFEEWTFPVWYFQGIEKMRYITILNLINRLLFISLIFILVREKSDYILVPIIYGIGSVSVGTIALWIIFKKHNLKFKWNSKSILSRYFTESIPFFLSSASVRIYLSANKIIIGTFLGMAEVAYYDISEKVILLLKKPIEIISQTIFPKTSRDRDTLFIKKMIKKSSIVIFALTIIILLSADWLVVILEKFIGSSLPTVGVILRILALTLPIVNFASYFGMQLLVPFGYKKDYTRSYILSGMAFLICFIFLFITEKLNIYTITLNTVFSELTTTTLMLYFVKRHKILK